MQMLHPKLCQADIWVFATPVYVSGMTGPLKNLIDRILIPLGEPFLELRDGRCHHPLREGTNPGQVVLVSGGSRGIGRALVAYAEGLARDSGAEELVLLTGFGNAQGQAFYRALGYADWELAMRRRFEL